MSSLQAEAVNAEERFRQAFERLKAGQTELLPRGAPVTQNNVAREAGCDPSALKKSRYPTLVGQIQGFLQLQAPEDAATAKAPKQKAVKRATEVRLADALRQRDMAQSVLVSANLRIVELVEEVLSLRRRLEAYEPPPVKLGRR